MTFATWELCVDLMRNAYGARLDLDAKGIVVWFELLKDLDDEAVKAAVKQMCQEVEWPAVPTIRKLAALPPLGGEEAWLKALTFAQESGGMYPKYRGVGPIEYVNGRIASPPQVERVEPAPLPPLVKDALTAIGGVQAVRNARDVNALRKDFVKQYEALAAGRRARGEQEALPPSPGAGTVIGPVDLGDAMKRIGKPMPEVGP